jgi:hypothetical protein
MFYSIEEAAQKLGKTVDQVREMAARGQLQEFRDRDALVFKREQVDLLAGDDVIPLADSGELEPLSLQSSGSSMVLSPEPKESTGINIFEAEGTEEADPSAVTRVTASPGSLIDPGDKSASGSGGLLDMTREPDDTSLGADLLGDVYGNETLAAQTTAEPALSDGGALFETPSAVMEAPETTTTTVAMVAAEPYDGAGSGWVGGLALGAIIAVSIAAFTLIVGLTSTAGGGMLKTIGDNFMILVGVAAGLPILFAIIGLLIGKRS